ncbi:MAG: HlyD family efflux transporter periplasmic adaptor subunit [Gemmatimonadaceae bacterium]|nr:HlyD family efflux transporter periplasmic adaptor subunit [Gemmatimonadaceae bacterium]
MLALLGMCAASAVAWLSLRAPDGPVLNRSAILIDSVRRGDLLRDVRGTGTLVPERSRLITAQTSARVERLAQVSGAHVAPGDVLLVLSNPDLQIQLMLAEQQVRQAEMGLLSLEASLRGQVLTQEGVVATTTTQYVLATQDASAAESLSTLRLVSTFDVRAKRAAREELTTRLRIEQARLVLTRDALARQLSAQRAQIAQLQQIVGRQRDRLQSLTVRASDSGVLQDLSLQVGQWVPEGTALAKVVQPDQLKAVLRIPESQARDVFTGQMARIDTRNGVVRGHVTRKDPAAQSGNVTVDVALDDALPRGAVPDLNVDGTIIVEQLHDVLQTGRPAQQSDTGTTAVFKLAGDGRTAVRTLVSFGRNSVNLVEVRRGLAPGDRIIVSDMSQYASTPRVRLR